MLGGLNEATYVRPDFEATHAAAGGGKQGFFCASNLAKNFLLNDSGAVFLCQAGGSTPSFNRWRRCILCPAPGKPSDLPEQPGT